MPRTPKVVPQNDYRDLSPDKMQFKHMSADEVAREYLRDPKTLMVSVDTLVLHLTNLVEDLRDEIRYGKRSAVKARRT